MDYNENFQTLRFFNEKADILQRCSFTTLVFTQETGVRIFARLGEPATVERHGPDEESISAFVLTYRFFIQNNERISFSNLAKLYHELPISEEKKGTFDDIRTSINNFLDSNTMFNINNSIITRRQLMDVFIYGGLAHANLEKKRIFDSWMRNYSFLNSLLVNEFVAILGNIMHAIEAIKNLNLEVLTELNI